MADCCGSVDWKGIQIILNYIKEKIREVREYKMNENNLYEEWVIDVKGLLFAVLYRWRSIITVALILGILLGGYKVTSGILMRQDPSELVDQEETYQKDMELYQQTLAGYERDIASLKSRLEDHQVYMNESVLMQVDPSSRPKAYAEYLVKLDESGWQQYPQTVEMDPTDSLVHSYIANLTQWINWDGITKETGVDEKYLKELISISLDYNSNTFVTEVTYEDLDKAEWILDEILLQITGCHDELVELVGSHTISLVNRGSGYFYDSSLADLQKQNSDKITSYENNLKEKKNALETLEIPEKPAVMSNKGVVKDGIKFGIIGVLAGVFLSAFCFFSVYILNGRVHTEGDLKSQFKLRVLGTFALPERKGFLCGIDRWLERLEGTAERPSEEEVLERCVVNIQNYTEEGSQILFTGTVSEEQLQRLGSKLSEKLTGRNLVISPDMNKSTETLRQLADCQAVILVEQREVSRLNDIREELESVQGLKKPVVGCLVM